MLGSLAFSIPVPEWRLTYIEQTKHGQQKEHCGKNYNKRVKIGTVGGVMNPNLKEKCKILVWM